MSLVFGDEFLAVEPDRASIEALSGLVLLEFGASWCPHCQAADALLREILPRYPQFRRLRIADGKGQPLGRSFSVKRWPTLIFLNNGQECARLVRPTAAHEIEELLLKHGSA